MNECGKEFVWFTGQKKSIVCTVYAAEAGWLYVVNRGRIVEVFRKDGVLRTVFPY